MLNADVVELFDRVPLGTQGRCASQYPACGSKAKAIQESNCSAGAEETP